MRWLLVLRLWFERLRQVKSSEEQREQQELGMLFVLYHKGSKSLEIDHTLKETAIDSFTCSAAFLHSDVGWSWGCVTLSHPEIWAERS